MSEKLRNEYFDHLPAVVTVGNVEQESNRRNEDRIAEFKRSFNLHDEPEECRREYKATLLRLYNYFNSAGKNWQPEFGVIEEESYHKGWEQAKKGKPEVTMFIEDMMASKRESYIRGFADRRFLKFLERYDSGETNNVDAKNVYYSHPQIAIAHKLLGVKIDDSNAKSILSAYAHPDRKPGKLLAISKMLIHKLVFVNEDKSGNTKRMINVEAAERLVSAIQQNQGKKTLDPFVNNYITKFKNDYNDLLEI